MRLKNKQLLNLPAYTKANDFLGRVSSFEVDSETRLIVKYYIGSSSLVRKILKDEPELIINDSAVIEISEEKMIVKDSVIKQKVNEAENAPAQEAPATTINSEID